MKRGWACRADTTDTRWTVDEGLQRIIAAHVGDYALYPRHVRALQTLCGAEVRDAAGLRRLTAADFKRWETEPRYRGAPLAVLRLAFRNEGGRLNEDDAMGWPNRFGRWMAHRIAPEDQEYVRTFIDALDERLRLQYPRRDPMRSRRSLVNRCCVFFGVVQRMAAATDDGGTTSIRSVLPFDLDEPGLRAFTERLMATWSADRSGTVGGAAVRRTLVGILKTAVKAGLFPRVAVRRGTFGGTLWVGGTSAGGGGARAPPTDAEMDRLRAAALRSGPGDRLLVALLATTGVRVEAASRLMLAQLWDARTKSVRSLITVREKNSEDRTIVPCAELRAAIQAYAETTPNARRYVFGVRPSNVVPPDPSTVRKRLARLCAAAGVRRFNPHAFRAYVVTLLRRMGLDAATVCKFIGHKGPQTQNAHYWKEDADAVGAAVLAGQDDDTVRGLQRRLAAARERLAVLEARRDALGEEEIKNGGGTVMSA